ncbi:hypothetical protein APED_16140 [Acanthopleuribacter pedis]|uniref:Uncharacterized protein n=2 Tax=Acanthopleuribacter pedis TaxID=442870 RepID=A0A8J7QPX4_9BACT|nr:hypothetical protein [Acanthopleuribacter pedis]
MAELMVALLILSLLSVSAHHYFITPLRDHQFSTFAAWMCSDFQKTLTHAQMTYQPLRMNLSREAGFFYRVETRVENQWLTLSSPLKHNRYLRSITRSVPASLPHPHDSGRTLDHAFRSNHAPYLYFRRVGSSSGTVAFSDRDGRTLCFILAGDANRLRAYLWFPKFKDWQPIL